MAQLNEDELLRISVEEEEMLDENLCDIFLKDFERLSNKLLSHVTTIGVTCDNELAKSMRTDDPRRESVVATVGEQVALVKEIAKATLAEMCELSRPKIAERVFEILREGKVNSVSQLQEHMSKCAAMTELMKEVCEILHCRDSEVSMRVRGLSAAFAVEKKAADELRLQLIQKDSQIEQLRQDFELLVQHKKVNALADNDDSNGAVQEPGSLIHHSSNQSLQRDTSRSWMPSSRPCCEIMRRDGCGTCQRMVQSTAGTTEFLLSDYIRTMSLPEVQPFSGRQGECFKRFVNSFEMKYPREQWKDSNRVQLFQSFLRNNALTVFETLPREVREGTYDGIIEAMKARMRIDGNTQRVKALADMRLLAMRPGQQLSEFCFALESLANRAYPDMPPEATSLQKAEILCRQLANWDGSYCLTEALETSKCEEAYEKVKEAALRLERSLKTVEECRLLDEGRGEYRHGHHTFDRRGEAVVDKSPGSSSRSDSERTSKPTLGGRPESAPLVSKEKRERGSPRCYNCGVIGHLAKDCRDRPGPQQSTPTTLNAQQRPNEYASLVENWVCTSWWEPKAEICKLFGEKPLMSIKLCGIEAKALLDTGSQTTIIPVRVLKKAIDRNVDLDKYIERIPGPNTKVRDASGNIMEFLDTIRVAITLEGQEKVVPAFVGRKPDEVVILGTNALELFNLRLLKYSEAKREQMTNRANATVAKIEGPSRATTRKRNKRRHTNVHNVADRVTTDCVDTSPLGLISRGSAAHTGMKVAAVGPPRRGKSYKQGRSDMINVIEADKSTALLMKKGLRNLYPTLESSQEPSYGLGVQSKSSSREVHSSDAIKEYDALRTYNEAEVDLPPLEAAEESRFSRTRSYFKQKKQIAAGISKGKSGRTFTSFRNSRCRMESMVPPQMCPLQISTLHPPWIFTSTSTTPRGSWQRGQEHGAHHSSPHYPLS